jgi:hypothetical protein
MADGWVLAFVLLFWEPAFTPQIHPVKGPIPTFSIDYTNPSELTGAVLWGRTR